MAQGLKETCMLRHAQDRGRSGSSQHRIISSEVDDFKLDACVPHTHVEPFDQLQQRAQQTACKGMLLA